MLLSLFEQDCIDVRCQWVTDKARRSWFLLEAPVDIAWCDTKGRNIGLVFFLSCPCFWKSFGYCMHPDNNAALQLNFMMLQVGLPVVLHLHCSVLTICVSFSVILSFRCIIFLFICIGKHPLIFCWYLYFPFSDYFFNQRSKLTAVCHHVHWNPVPSPLAPLHPLLLCVCKSSPVNSNSEQSRVALLISPGPHLLDGVDDDEMVPDGMIKASHHHIKVINLSFTNGNL